MDVDRKYPIIGHLVGLDNALRRQDPAAARAMLTAVVGSCGDQSMIRMATAHEDFTAQVRVFGGDVEEAITEVNRIALASGTHESARRDVLGRLMRGEPSAGAVHGPKPDAHVTTAAGT